eukprot:CCRYP_006456-RA/>CCRYP_006456-RA protein AED:0.43 eAED:0.42 QI:0/0/0/1/1/1/2/0/255
MDSDDEGLLEGVGFLEVEKRMSHNRNKIYLDSCATNHKLFAGEYANNIHKVAVGLRQNCIAGSSIMNKMGYWWRFKLWYSPNKIANLLSVPKLERDGYKIDLWTEKGCKVHAPDGTVLHFKWDTGLFQGMPYLDMDDTQFTTVHTNYESFNCKEVDKAILACKAQGMMGSPSDDAFSAMVSTMPNCTISRQDITNAHAIFGPSRKGLRGETVRKKPGRIEPEFVPIPKDYQDLHKFVTLKADVMFGNGILFFRTL